MQNVPDSEKKRKKEMKYDYLVVGAGLYGAVFAREARDAGKSVLVIERRDHIGGNAYTENIDGIEVHRYGPHIFHTDNEAVWNYVNRFAEFNNFINCPVADFHGEIYPLPFNMNTFEKMWGVKRAEDAMRIISEQRNEITGTPTNLEEQAIALVGREIYEKLIKGYTEKQWGRDCRELPPEIIRRLPVRFTYDNNYYNDKFQGIPVGGYTKMVSNMLDGIEIKTGVNYLENKDYWDEQAEKIVFTGAIDEYFGFSLGCLEYRTVRFDTVSMDVPYYQKNAVVNYTDRDTPWTRIIEHKWFDPHNAPMSKTVITKEFSSGLKPGAEPYYPVNDDKNERLYEKYKMLADKETNVIFGGRLAEFRYYDMDEVIERALEKSNAKTNAKNYG